MTKAHGHPLAPRHVPLPGALALLVCLLGCSYPDVPPCVDRDGDGYGDPANYRGGCAHPGEGDCDDHDPDTHPGAEPICDAVPDNDCDGEPDPTEEDLDGDGLTPCEGDCDDSDASTHPSAVELCDGVDNDCDDAIDEAEDLAYEDYWPDADGDGFGDGEVASISACAPVQDHVTNGQDCDDDDDSVYPQADEACDGVDTDCDGSLPTEEADEDGDGVLICDGDCDDDDPTVHPGHEELCDGQDNDCDGSIGSEETDDDGDGWTECDGDCDDEDDAVSPGADEACDGLDTDCDGVLPADEVDDDTDGVPACHDCDDADPSRTDDGCVLAMASGRILGGIADQFFGSAIAPVHDADGDGFDEMIIGAPESALSGAGTAYLFEQPLTGTLDVSASLASFSGELSGDRAGYSVASEDVNGDGVPDLLIGARDNDDLGYTNSGKLYLVHGPSTGALSLSNADARIVGQTDFSHVAESVSSAGDVDGDSNPDIAVGAHHTYDHLGNEVGAAYVIRGPVVGDIHLCAGDGSSTLGPDDAVFWGESWGERAGSAVAGPLDFNGDGLGDVIIAAKSDSVAGLNAGAVYVVYGPTSGSHLLHDVSSEGFGIDYWGEADWDEAGSSVGAPGDIDGDGFDDLLVGSPAHVGGDGAAYLVLGSPNPTGGILSGAHVKLYGDVGAVEWAGYSVSGAGDMDGDGAIDLLVGLPGQHDGSGAVYLVSWTDVESGGAFYLSTVVTHAIEGPDLGTRLGYVARHLGDVDGDGLPDYVFSGASEYSNTGAIYQVLGADLP